VETLWASDVRRWDHHLTADVPDIAGHLFGRDRKPSSPPGTLVEDFGPKLQRLEDSGTKMAALRDQTARSTALVRRLQEWEDAELAEQSGHVHDDADLDEMPSR